MPSGAIGVLRKSASSAATTSERPPATQAGQPNRYERRPLFFDRMDAMQESVNQLPYSFFSLNSASG
jgi:hypothetical protein